jgi:Gpi18-like mannosyltransferase
LFLPGHPTDVSTFVAWASRLARVGPWRFYEPEVFADYAPGYLLVLWPIGFLAGVWPSAAAGLVKAIPAAADFLAAAALARLSPAADTRASRAFLFSPAVLFVGAYWGQAESVAVCALLGGFVLARKGAATLAGALLGLAVVIKPQVAVAAPFAAIFAVRAGGASLAGAARGGLAATAVIAASAALFRLAPWELAAHVLRSSAVYPYASVNALNLWHALRANWARDDTLLFGMPMVVWGGLLTMVALGTIALSLRARRDVGAIFVGAAAAFTSVYFLATRMHERYLFPALPFLLLAWAWRAAGSALVVAMSAVLTAGLVYGYAYVARFPDLRTPFWFWVTRAFTEPVAAGWAAAGLLTWVWVLLSLRALTSAKRSAQAP